MSVTEINENLSPYKGELGKLLKEIGAEFINIYGKRLLEYIETGYDKFSHITTFLSVDTKVPFYDTYYPIKLSSRKQLYDSSQIIYDFFLQSNTIGILGMAGSGKSMLIKHIYLQCLKLKNRIPIYIELRSLNNYDKTLSDYIYEIVLENKIKPNNRILENAFDDGKFIFLFDGFDELIAEKKSEFLFHLERFIDRFKTNHYIISSRPGTSIQSFPRLVSFNILPLTEPQIAEFIKIQVKYFEDQELANKLLKVIQQEINADFFGYIQNPLLLSMFILTYKNNPEIPRSKHKFYWNVFHTLAIKHDSLKKGSFLHPRKTGLLNEDFEKLLKALCFITLDKYEFTFEPSTLHKHLTFVRNKLGMKFVVEDMVYDLVTSISILIEDGGEYRFPHRTLQDYFCMSFILDQKDDIKKAIYTTKIKEVLISPLSNIAFFQLALEMDKRTFCNEYLFPRIDRIIDRIIEPNTLQGIMSEGGFSISVVLNRETKKWELLNVNIKPNFDTELMEWLGVTFTQFLYFDPNKVSLLLLNEMNESQSELYDIYMNDSQSSSTFPLILENVSLDNIDLRTIIDETEVGHNIIRCQKVLCDIVSGLKRDIQREADTYESIWKDSYLDEGTSGHETQVPKLNF